MVPEPPSDGDLWPRVKAITGWPDTDEDRIRALDTATQGEQAMRQLAASADAFAADVEHVKT